MNFLIEKNKGQITVFLSLVLLAVILVAAVLVDLSRVSAGRTLAKRAVGSAARSVMAEYGSKLSDEYGIFALAEKDSSVLEGEMKDYISRNLTIPTKDDEYQNRIDLYGFRIEEVKVTPLYNLGENGVFRSQVLECMKYRAPKELVEGFLDRLSVFRETGRMSAAYKKKVGIDKTLGRMDKSQQSLKKKVDGDGTSGMKYVNGFNAGGSWKTAFDRFNSLCSGLDSLKKGMEELESQISQLQASLREDGAGGAGGEENSGDAGGMADRLTELLEQRRSMADSFSSMQASFESSWNDLRYGLTGDFGKPVREASAEVNKIVETGKKAETELSELENFLAENFTEEDSFSRDFVSTTNEEIKKLKGLILSGRKAEEILAGLSVDANVINDLTGRLDTIKNSIGGATGYTIPFYLSDGINGLLGSYANIDYNYEKPQKGESGDDPRKGKKEEAGRTLLDKLTSDRNYLSEGIKAQDLPSNTKIPSHDFKDEDAPYLGEDNGRGSGSTTNDPEASYEGDLARIGESADLYDEEGTFQENALGFIGDIGKIASGDMKKLRDNVYLNEYIMGCFGNSVPSLVNSSKTAEDKDFRGRIKSERETFYEAEVEYILHGNASENANKLMTRAQILLVRFGLDTLHVYTDVKKKQVAAGIATAVTGWWTGGAGIPVITNLIMCGWGMGEAVIDLTDLLGGESVPVYKLKGDWKLEIGAAKSGGPKTDSRLCFSYYDYLRLFLLGMNEKNKMDRMEDLIQLNMGKSSDGFRMTDCRTAVRVEAVISMKYMFLGGSLMPESVRTADGRHKFSILAYEGY